MSQEKRKREFNDGSTGAAVFKPKIEEDLPIDNESDLSREIGADFRQSSQGFEGGNKDEEKKNKFTNHNQIEINIQEDDIEEVKSESLEE